MGSSPIFTEKTKFLIDGFPRNADNVKGWDDVVKDQAQVAGIIYIKCSEVDWNHRRTL